MLIYYIIITLDSIFVQTTPSIIVQQTAILKPVLIYPAPATISVGL